MTANCVHSWLRLPPLKLDPELELPEFDVMEALSEMRAKADEDMKKVLALRYADNSTEDPPASPEVSSSIVLKLCTEFPRGWVGLCCFDAC